MKKRWTIQVVFMMMALGVLSACQTTPEPTGRYVPTLTLGNPEVLLIAPERTACVSAKPMQCLIAKREQGGEAFGIAYDGVAGFYPKVGVAYKIVARPQIDQAKGEKTGLWTLDEILAQEIVPSS